MIEIKLHGPEGIGKLERLPGEVKNGLYEGMLKVRELIMTTSKTKYLSGPYPKVLSVDSGLLRSREPIVSDPLPGEGVNELARMQIGPPGGGTWYGRVHEQQGSPWTSFPIFAKSPKGMTFFWKRKNIWIYGARSVYIPARPYMRPALIDSLAKIRIILQESFLKGFESSKMKG